MPHAEACIFLAQLRDMANATGHPEIRGRWGRHVESFAVDAHQGNDIPAYKIVVGLNNYLDALFVLLRDNVSEYIEEFGWFSGNRLSLEVASMLESLDIAAYAYGGEGIGFHFNSSSAGALLHAARQAGVKDRVEKQEVTIALGDFVDRIEGQALQDCDEALRSLQWCLGRFPDQTVAQIAREDLTKIYVHMHNVLRFATLSRSPGLKEHAFNLFSTHLIRSMKAQLEGKRNSSASINRLATNLVIFSKKLNKAQGKEED